MKRIDTIDDTYILIYKKSVSALKTSLIEIFKPKGCQSQLGSYIICSVIYTTTGHRPNELEKELEIEFKMKEKIYLYELGLGHRPVIDGQIMPQSMLTRFISESVLSTQGQSEYLDTKSKRL